VLPRGIPIGVVAAEREGEAIVDLYANYARTRLVRVVNYKFPTVEPVEEEEPSADGTDEAGREAAAVAPETVQAAANATAPVSAPAALIAAEHTQAAPPPAPPEPADADEETSPEPVAD
jgi:hypothetical protein